MASTPILLATCTQLVEAETVLMCKWLPTRCRRVQFEWSLISCSWNPSGLLIGKFAVSGGSNNFAFVPGGMYIFNGYKLFKVTLNAEGREVRRDFGLGEGRKYA